MATEKFLHITWQILKDCPDAYNIHDDIRVIGSSEEQHDERLNKVMKKLEEGGLTLNYDKCQIGVLVEKLTPRNHTKTRCSEFFWFKGKCN